MIREFCPMPLYEGVWRERVAAVSLVALGGLASVAAFFRLAIGFFAASSDPVASTSVWGALAEGLARFPAVLT